MRWLLALTLLSCGEDMPCNDAPLGGLDGICTRIEGSWRLGAFDGRRRCGAELLSKPLQINSSGSELFGTVGTSRFHGTNFASGAFELEANYESYSLRGQYRVVEGEPELIGSVVFGGRGQTCDAMWDFIARRE